MHEQANLVERFTMLLGGQDTRTLQIREPLAATSDSGRAARSAAMQRQDVSYLQVRRDDLAAPVRIGEEQEIRHDLFDNNWIDRTSHI